MSSHDPDLACPWPLRVGRWLPWPVARPRRAAVAWECVAALVHDTGDTAPREPVLMARWDAVPAAAVGPWAGRRATVELPPALVAAAFPVLADAAAWGVASTSLPAGDAGAEDGAAVLAAIECATWTCETTTVGALWSGCETVAGLAALRDPGLGGLSASTIEAALRGDAARVPPLVQLDGAWHAESRALLLCLSAAPAATPVRVVAGATHAGPARALDARVALAYPAHQPLIAQLDPHLWWPDAFGVDPAPAEARPTVAAWPGTLPGAITAALLLTGFRDWWYDAGASSAVAQALLDPRAVTRALRAADRRWIAAALRVAETLAGGPLGGALAAACGESGRLPLPDRPRVGEPDAAAWPPPPRVRRDARAWVAAADG